MTACSDTCKCPANSPIADALCDLSIWIDSHNDHRSEEAITWGRVAKVAEESGEAIAALIAATGQNPRKQEGVGDYAPVVEELLDVAITALGAIEHLQGHGGQALNLLDHKIMKVCQRARIAPRNVP